MEPTRWHALRLVVLLGIVWQIGATAYADMLTLSNGNMEAPVVGTWTSTIPSNWTWTADSGSGTVGLSRTGGALGTAQTFYGNNIKGTLTSAPLSQTIPNLGVISVTYWAKRENTGSVSLTANCLVGGVSVASRLDLLGTNAWTQYTLNYPVAASDVGKSIQVQFVFSNGSGNWQGYLDEVAVSLSPGINFVGSSGTQQDTTPLGTVNLSLTGTCSNPVTVDCRVIGGTAVLGTDYSFTPGTLTFAPGITGTSLTFGVNKFATYKGSRTIVFGLSNPSNALLGSGTTFTVTIIDPEDKPAPVTYYIDSINGNDANSGTSPNSAWQSLSHVNSTTFNPGDVLLFKAGGVWNGQAMPQGSGDATAQITMDMYGTGAKPVINAGGINGGAVYLYNQQYWSINNLELTNSGTSSNPKKQGILVVNDCVGTLNGIYVRNCFIHDVNGVMANYVDGKESGGIVFKITSSDLNTPSNWNDIKIENNTLQNISREGVLMESMWVNKPQDPNTYWSGLGNYFPSTNIRIAYNTLQVIGGDGIIPWAVKGAMVEHNYVSDCNTNTPGQGHAAVWPYICENIVFQYNEVCRTRTTYDGMAFDFDNSNQNCIYQYNYSHDNEGGFLNMCSAGNGNGNIARYNISQNDGCASGSRVFLVDSNGNHNYAVYNNSVYVSNSNPTLFYQGAASGSSSIYFSNNIFVNSGTGPVSSPGGCYFDHNLFYGNGSIASDLHKVLANPQIAGAGSGGSGLASVGGYKLLTTSPALGSGTLIANNGGQDYWGNLVSNSASPNLGAYGGAGISGWQWNPLGGNSASDGAGTWDNSSLNWWDGETLTNWPGTSMGAGFGAGTGAAGQVTITGTQSVGGLTFNTPGSGSYVIAGGNLNLGLPTITANADAVISSVLQGSGITKSGTGTLTLGGVNNYTGPTTVNAGTLAIVGGAKIYSPGWQAWVTTVNAGGTLLLEDWSQGLMSDYAAANLVLNGGTIAYSGSQASSPASIDGANGRAFSIGALGGTLESRAPAGFVWAITRYNSANTYPLAALSGTLTLAGTGNGYISKTLSGTGGIVKAGSGTWTLAGTNSYTGYTTINSGTLKLAAGATLAGTPRIVMASGATLDISGSGLTLGSGQTLAGSGNINGPIALATGPASIGMQDGTASTLLINGGLKFNGGNVLGFDVGSSSDRISVNGAYTAPVSGTVTVNIAGIAGFGPGTYNLITGASGINASNYVLGSVPTGHLYALVASGGTLSLVIDGIESWRLANFGSTANTGNAADNANPAGDGICNLMKYAVGMSPLTRSSNPPAISGTSVTGGYTFLTLAFNQVADPALTYVVEASNDLSTNWTPIWTSTGSANITGAVTVTDGIPLGQQSKRFLRLRVVH